MCMSPKKREATREQIARLAKAVAERMDDLDLTQQQVQDAGGPSTTTLSHLAGGTSATPIKRTLDGLDEALEWIPHSASNCLWRGITPTPLPSRLVEAVASGGETWTADESRVALAHLRAAQDEITHAVEALLLLASKQPRV